MPHGTAVVLLDEVQFMEAPQFGGDRIAGVHALLLAGIEVEPAPCHGDHRDQAVGPLRRMRRAGLHDAENRRRRWPRRGTRGRRPLPSPLPDALAAAGKGGEGLTVFSSARHRQPL
jgi:hypothetical protein